MKVLCGFVFAFLCAASSTLHAEVALGRVRAIYVEAARNVLVDYRGQHAPAWARVWADVELGGILDTERRRVLVQVPQELRVSPGDTVAMQIEETQLSRITANQVPMLRVSRVTEVRTRALAGLSPAN
jgi:P pilus assembly chaperone PapD